MKKMFIYQHFHSVGNGTFKTGSIFNLSGSDSFYWVYDCGSTRKTSLKHKIQNMSTHPCFPSNIDMLVLSHFDEDHVNGVEDLLRHCHVKSLVLPFSEWTQSVREISVLGKKGTSPSTALLQLNPLQWLATREFDVQVDEVVLIQGGSDRPPNALGEEKPNPKPDDFQRDDDSSILGDGYFTFNQPTALGTIKLRTIKHDRPMYAIKSNFEFIFFNAEKDFTELGLIINKAGKLYSKKSNRPLSDVKADIQNTIMSLNLHNPTSVMPLDWRKTLKKCYQKHFGHTSQAKNNISLCMYAAPAQMETSIFMVRSNLIMRPNSLSPTSRLATLCTGDIHLTPEVISDLRNHLGPQRWDKIGLIQVPHHGSKNSWKVGNAALLSPAQFLHCASGTKHHPHSTVIKDLSGKIVHTANNTSGVSIKYLV
ncbi:TPA: hypothetical protein ACGFAK_004971 [Serratia marcescens]|uniref:hypothetical protein n=1 Tax=Serratia marcescens TaxID=615 RepID=UPI0029E4CBC2|nr:hypothetical protein [Serratia marcescens]HEJ7038077.1 hypothetical protein [Serratia marcescens]